MKKIIRVLKIFLLMIFFLLPNFSLAAINFTNGKWETTFNCVETYQFESTLNCDGMDWGGAWFFDSHRTQIITDANNAVGLGGRGIRFWKGDGSNQDSGTVTVEFPAPSPEIWIRWYQKYQTGFDWEFLGYDKTLYIRANGGATDVIPEFNDDDYVLIAQGTYDYYQVKTNGYGWQDVMGGSTGDGQWHAYEIHLKMDTNSINGIGKFWVDGELQISNIVVDWSDGDQTARNGWDYFEFDSNQNAPIGGPYYVDYDDMVIYNSPPPNVDVGGNSFIGPVGWVNGGDVIAPSSPTGLSIL